MNETGGGDTLSYFFQMYCHPILYVIRLYKFNIQFCYNSTLLPKDIVYRNELRKKNATKATPLPPKQSNKQTQRNNNTAGMAIYNTIPEQ